MEDKKSSEVVIRAQKLYKSYHIGKLEHKVIKNFSLEVPAHKFSVFIGPSGCGKTTLLNLFGTIDLPSSGDLEVAGRQVLKMKDDELAKFRAQQIGFIFQNFNLIPVLNVFENVSYPLRLSGLEKGEIRERVTNILKKVGMDKFSKNKPNELSGGQQQRVSIARALVGRPSLVLADEPTANLDSKTSIQILNLMRELCDESKVSFIFVTHDPIIVDFSDVVYKMKDGELIEKSSS